jgi:hypothetical protein
MGKEDLDERGERVPKEKDIERVEEDANGIGANEEEVLRQERMEALNEELGEGHEKAGGGYARLDVHQQKSRFPRIEPWRKRTGKER